MLTKQFKFPEIRCNRVNDLASYFLGSLRIKHLVSSASLADVMPCPVPLQAASHFRASQLILGDPARGLSESLLLTPQRKACLAQIERALLAHPQYLPLNPTEGVSGLHQLHARLWRLSGQVSTLRPFRRLLQRLPAC